MPLFSSVGFIMAKRYQRRFTSCWDKQQIMCTQHRMTEIKRIQKELAMMVCKCAVLFFFSNLSTVTSPTL